MNPEGSRPAPRAPSAPRPAPGKAAPVQPALRRLGDFTLLSELGRGGMGVVYKARQESMGRLVALKVLPSFAGMDPDAVQRFRREAEAAGRLSHAGVVPVYAVGEAEGIHYFAMELVEGPSLQSLLDSLKGRVPGRLLGTLAEESGLAETDPGIRSEEHSARLVGAGARYARSCAALCADVANALAAAHASKIIHRDLKPSNILLRKGGRPVLVDFGLSRDELAVGLTQSGEAVGTPSYMSPEQARGSKAIDARVDIYGLGATLYEMLALRPPFEGAHAGEIMRKILDEEPTPLRKLNERVPPELETIIEACLQKDPDLRYPAAEALEHDLRAFLRGESVVASRGSMIWRLRSSVRRHRRALSFGALAIVASGLTIATMGIVSSRSSRERGLQALGEARTALVERRDPTAAREAYGRAAALLGDAALVSGAQREHLREAFGILYAGGEHGVLRQVLAEVPVEARDAEIARFERQLAGIGKLELPAGFTRDQVSVRRAQGGVLQVAWEKVAEDGELPVGHYLVRLQRPGSCEEVHRVVIDRDRAAQPVPLARAFVEAPEGTVLATPRPDLATAWVARTETTGAQYAAVLERCDDPELRAELVPKVPFDRTREAPVRGLSYRQARLAAAWLGGHLPTLAEFRQAASSGVEGLRYPWGNAFDKARVVADPDTRNDPENADSLPAGAAPSGALHLVGNVAEFLAQESPGKVGLAGGHWQSDARDVEIAAPPRELTSLDEAPTFAGMRVFRFVRPSDDPQARVAARAHLDAALAAGTAFTISGWRIADDGRVLHTLRLSGHHAKDASDLVLTLQTDGFLHDGEPVVRDGRGAQLTTQAKLATSGTTAELMVRTQGRRGERFVAEVAQSLVPVTGLRLDGAAYVLEVPTLASAGHASQHEIVLPTGVALEACEPEPRFQWVEEGRVHLLFEHVPHPSGARIAPVSVRFRKDGLLTRRWPASQRLQQAAERVFRALDSRTESDLRTALSPHWQHFPSELDLAGLARAAARRTPGERFLDFKITDAWVVGEVATLDLVVAFTAPDRDGQELTVRGWGMRLSLLREGNEWRGLRLEPKSRADTGALVQGSYQHSQLKVEWSPPAGSRLVRKIVHPCEVQVGCRLEDLAATVTLLGEISGPEDDETQIKLRLSAGESRLRPGSREIGPELELVGPEELRKQAVCEDWLFGQAGRGAFARERWIFVRAGRRSFLVKLVATGPTPQAARETFERNKPVFAGVLSGLRIL